MQRCLTVDARAIRIPPVTTTTDGGGQRLPDELTSMTNQEAALPLSESCLVKRVPHCLGIVCGQCQNTAEATDAVGGACSCGAAFVRVVAMGVLQNTATRSMDDTLEPGFEPRPDDLPEDQLWQSTALEIMRRYWMNGQFMHETYDTPQDRAPFFKDKTVQRVLYEAFSQMHHLKLPSLTTPLA